MYLSMQFYFSPLIWWSEVVYNLILLTDPDIILHSNQLRNVYVSHDLYLREERD